MITKYKDKIIAVFIVAAVISTLLFAISKPDKQGDDLLGAAYQNAQWNHFDKFGTYYTKLDETKIPDGSTGKGQNTSINDGDRISIRNLGYELFPEGTATSSEDKINGFHTFRRRDGENIMMRAYDTLLEYYDEDLNSWQTVKSGYTADKDFGFADININTDATSYVYFGNGVESFSRWTGAHTLADGSQSSGAGTVTVDSTADFASTGTIDIGGDEYAYSSKNATTFTLTGTLSATYADNSRVIEAVNENGSNPKGNIYLAFDNRLLISGVTSVPQAVYFSAYGDATDYTGAALVTEATDATADLFNLVEGGGGVTGMVTDENSLYIFKRSMIYKVSLTDTNYTITPLKTFDGKSQTIGAVSSKCIFTGGNSVYFVTPDNQLMSLQRVESYDYPQVVAISDVIKPTVDTMNFDDCAGVVFRDKAYFAAKSDTTVTQNDTMLVWNRIKQIWDTPVLGWNVSDFTVYDDTTSEELYYAASVRPEVYKVNSNALDDIYAVTANWRSKQFDFNMPYSQKEILDVYVEGYISPDTTITVSLLLDEDGYTQTFQHDVNGTDSDIIYESEDFNVFGLSTFGSKRFGSNEDQSGKKKFRVYLGKDFRATPFYNAQIEFASDGENQDWEVLNYAFKWRQYSVPEKRELYQSFK